MIMSQHKNLAETPVEIAGAGPAGLVTAITLAHAGRRVIVHETQKAVGHRFGGDFQGLENWTTKKDVLESFKSLGITTNFIARPCRDGTVFDPAGKPYGIKSDDVLFYLVERGPGPGSLDNALLEQAQSLGVEVRFNSQLRQIAYKGILATGPCTADVIAVGYHFETTMADGYWAICDNKLAPQGYAYLLVMNGRGTVKTCMFSDFKRKALYLQRTLATFQRLVGLDMINPQPHGGIGNFHIPRSAYNEQRPIVGEQAGFQDILWGFGMRPAISSGILVAQSLLGGKNYDDLWRRVLRPQMETSVVNRALYSLVSKRGFSWFLGRLVSRKNLRESLRRQYQPSLLKRLLVPWAVRQYENRRKDVKPPLTDHTR